MMMSVETYNGIVELMRMVFSSRDTYTDFYHLCHRIGSYKSGINGHGRGFAPLFIFDCVTFARKAKLLEVFVSALIASCTKHKIMEKTCTNIINSKNCHSFYGLFGISDNLEKKSIKIYKRRRSRDWKILFIIDFENFSEKEWKIMDETLKRERRSSYPFGGCTLICFADFCLTTHKSSEIYFKNPLFKLFNYVDLNSKSYSSSSVFSVFEECVQMWKSGCEMSSSIFQLRSPHEFNNLPPDAEDWLIVTPNGDWPLEFRHEKNEFLVNRRKARLDGFFRQFVQEQKENYLFVPLCTKIEKLKKCCAKSASNKLIFSKSSFDGGADFIEPGDRVAVILRKKHDWVGPSEMGIYIGIDKIRAKPLVFWKTSGKPEFLNKISVLVNFNEIEKKKSIWAISLYPIKLFNTCSYGDIEVMHNVDILLDPSKIESTAQLISLCGKAETNGNVVLLANVDIVLKDVCKNNQYIQSFVCFNALNTTINLLN